MGASSLRPWLALLVSGLALFAPGCGGGFSPPAQDPPPAAAAPAAYGTLNVHLTSDGPAPAFTQMNLLLSGMSMEVDGTWTKVPLDALKAAASQSVDLLSLTSAAPATLAKGVPWSGGPNTGIRLMLAPGATVQLAADGASHPLSVQPELEVAMGLPGGFSVVPGFTTDLWLVVGLANAALPDPLNPGAFTFAPLAVRGYDKAATGVLTGQASAPGADGPQPLAGVTVTAQLAEPLGSAGAGIAFRTAVTDGAGKYTLDLLPVNLPWCAVGQATAGYAAAVSASAELGLAPYDAATGDVAFSPVAGTGAVNGGVAGTPPAGEVDVVELVQSLGTGDAPCDVTVQTALVAGGAFAFPAVPPGSYRAVLNRYAWAAGAGPLDQPSVTEPFGVQAGVSTVLRF